ncbi:hypothetical protein HYS54_03805, partial [Candidatus Micrarchaeota archaeon]|nr:hypothetical protein [Candidatus Micrarchaeota archaeon]
ACFRTSAQKYEVKIQLRKKQEHDEQLFKKLEDSIIILAGAASETDNKAASFWREDTRDGPDFLFGYKEVGEKIAKSLSKKFRVRMQESMQQNGFEKSGKPRIRITFCARV